MPAPKLISLKDKLSKYVKLNVGGYLFNTTIDTLTKYDSMLKSMFSGEMEVLIDSDEYILIDRCGKHFDKILNFLRNGKVCLPSSQERIRELLDEAQFYCIENLVIICEKALKKEGNSKLIGSITVTSSSKRCEKIIKASTKPILVLKMTKSLPISSDLFKNFKNNIELFESLSLQYSGFVSFIKFLSESETNECLWEFYDKSELIHKVDCYTLNDNYDSYRGEYVKEEILNFPEIEIYKYMLELFSSIVSSYKETEQETDDDTDSESISNQTNFA